jgi:hypothetical protein
MDETEKEELISISSYEVLIDGTTAGVLVCTVYRYTGTRVCWVCW